MLDHYQTLGVAAAASREEIKRAYRELAKKFHPDRNAGRAQWATAQMKRVIEANRVLSDPRLRAVYDGKHAAATARRRPESRLKHRREGNSPQARAERILHDLVNGSAQRAMQEYESLLRDNPNYDLSHHLCLKDWIDCKFLIAEQHERRNEFDRALAMYEEVYHSEHTRKRHAYFLKEVGERILFICTHAAPRHAAPQEAAQFLLRALGLEISRPQKAFLHKKIAECYLEIGDVESARRNLEIAFRHKPDLKGATKIRRRLSLD